MDTKQSGASEKEHANEAETETLLIVDDDAATRKLEVRILGSLGYKVLEADGSSEAMRLAVATATIHLLVTDFSMPEINGLELAHQFLSVHPKAPVLIVSGSCEEIYGRADYPARFALLAKPFTREGLVEQVRASLGGAPVSRSPCHPERRPLETCERP